MNTIFSKRFGTYINWTFLKNAFFFNLGELSPSRCSTPASSRSSSPEPRPKLVSSVSQPFDEKPTIMESFSDKSIPSAPLQIPNSPKMEEPLLSYQDNRESVSPSSSKAGTPTSSVCDFSTSVPSPTIPLLKMDARLQLKKSLNKSRLVIKHFETEPIGGNCVSTYLNQASKFALILILIFSSF